VHFGVGHVGANDVGIDLQNPERPDTVFLGQWEMRHMNEEFEAQENRNDCS
jgi:hypothetical protein